MFFCNISDTFWLHIRSTGGWTQKVYEYFNKFSTELAVNGKHIGTCSDLLLLGSTGVLGYMGFLFVLYSSLFVWVFCFVVVFLCVFYVCMCVVVFLCARAWSCVCVCVCMCVCVVFVGYLCVCVEGFYY